ncbi:DUF4129 domain-containing transglutaminase family protein [Anaerolinea thermophila]|uniref:Hypothetical membrane protein n=1 Tax=Anaerolinea thermophila (strain DSM 14523 / JCM 11388 / NBRC 100420 / UNI-1) TaxID=926569 RepID=E8MYQ5_ANATU|nr:transglutaminase domain-containing protein [Anaerolinea thermophila]BAJ64391.1 hypothetical membrane protein [Anaerolinea thermophila UNI-1]
MKDTKERMWDFSAGLLFWLALFFAAVRVQTTNWTVNLGLIQVEVFLSVIIGLALGASRFYPRLATFMGFLYTMTLLPWTLASLLRGETWLERVLLMVSRLQSAAEAIALNQPVRDPFFFLGLMCLIFWLAGIIGGYQLARYGRPWWGLGMAGIMVLIVDYSFEMYAAPDTGSAFSFLYFLVALILAGRVFYLNAHAEWKQRGEMVEGEVGFDISRGAALVALVLVLMGWYSPTLVNSFIPGTREQRELSQRFSRFRERISNAVFSLNSPAPVYVESLGETLALGQGSELSDDEVLRIKTERGRLAGGRFYWAGRIYDAYLDGQWVTTDVTAQGFGAGYALAQYDWQGRTEIGVDITNRISLLRTLYFPGAPISINRVVTAMVGPDGAEGPDITALILSPPLGAGESYSLRVSVPVPTQLQLQASASLPYPDWVEQRYLQLPPDFSPRIRQLAEQITAEANTPFEKADAITRWLRTSINYQTMIPPIPEGEDPMEWFLFEYRAGFCNYYATAEVLMLRAVGVPARMVVGYAEGTYLRDEEVFSVIGKDYHAWPEVYFPGIGWVPFEPTASQPELRFSLGEGDSSVGGVIIPPTPVIPSGAGPVGEVEPPAPIEEPPTPAEAAGRGLSVLLGVSAATALVFGLRRWKKTVLRETPFPVWLEQVIEKRGLQIPAWLKHWSQRAIRTPMERLFAVVPELLWVWGVPPRMDLTPAEQVANLKRVLPELAGEAQTLLEEYQRAMYSQRGYNIPRARQAAATLRLKGYQRWIARLMGIR